MPPEYSGLLRQLIDILKDGELVKSVKSIAEKDGWDKAAVILTGLTLLGLIYSLWMSRKLQETAQRQVQASLDALSESKRQVIEAVKQNRLAVRPLIVLEPAENYQALSDNTKLRYRNIGRGPAFAVSCSPVTHEGTRVVFEKVSLVREDTTHIVSVHVGELHPPEGGTATGVGHSPSLEAIGGLMRDGRLLNPISLDIEYRDLNGRRYRTIMSLSSDNTLPRSFLDLSFSHTEECKHQIFG